MNIEDLGERLKTYREKCGLKKNSVMEQLGFSRSSLNRYETGRRLPSVLVTAKMAQLYGVSLRELLGDTEPGRLFSPGELRFTCAPLRRKKEAEHKTWTQLDIECMYAPGGKALLQMACRGKRTPHLETVVWISEKLKIPIEDFFVTLEEDDEPCNLTMNA